MESIEIYIGTHGTFRASEVIADLREVTETLFNPLKLVGFWDEQDQGLHLCPQKQLGKECLHELPTDDVRRVSYATTAEEYMRAVLEVYFPHAGLFVYLK